MASEASVHHPIFARLFAWGASNAPAEQTEHRRRVLEGLRGRVIEVGAGNGLNFPHYPAGVTEVIAVEPEQYLRTKAAAAAAEAPVPLRVVDGLADSLPGGDGEFDAAVASLVLCSVPDQASALAELRRVLRPGGELRFTSTCARRNRRRRAARTAPTASGRASPAAVTPTAIRPLRSRRRDSRSNGASGSRSGRFSC